MLAAGIGANTAIFTLINALLLRDVPDSRVNRGPHGGQGPFSYPMFREVERNQRIFTSARGRLTGPDGVYRMTLFSNLAGGWIWPEKAS